MLNKPAHSRSHTYCTICEKDIYNFKTHLHKTHPSISEAEYYNNYIDNTTGKCYCGNNTDFIDIKKGFKKYCSHKCSVNDPAVIQKRMSTLSINLTNTYGEGITNPSQVPGSRKKARVSYHKTVNEKYGVEWSSQAPEVKNKLKQIHSERTIEDKRAITDKINDTLSKKHNITITNFGQIPGNTIKADIGYYNRIIEFLTEKNEYELLMTGDEFCNIRKEQREKYGLINQLIQIYPLKCRKHDTITLVSVSQFVNMFGADNHLCPKCQNGNISRAEKEVLEFINSVYKGDVISNTKKIIPPLELDIYIPGFKLGIEYHGLYWHSFAEKDYHRSKYLLGKERGIKVVQIFEDEWKTKSQIVKSMITNSLGLNTNRVYARKLTVIEDLDVKDFVNENHIAGHTNYIKSFSLVDDTNKIVSTLTVRKPFTKGKKGMIEIARFCSVLNTTVIGGFSKLMKQVKVWSKTEGFEYILTYADLRFGDGNVYLNNGFTFLDRTEPNYFYTTGNIREGRFKYRARNGVSEKIIAESNEVRKIYDCGSNKFVMKIE